MKTLQNISLIFTFTVLIYSCKSIRKVEVPVGSNSTIDISCKKEFSNQEIKTWAHADLETDSIPGMSMAKAYNFLKGKPSVPVIVAVLDSGIDIDHEDLVSTIWKNPNEIPKNGIDDDKNNFTDDTNGWNFLGNIYNETLEITRIYRKQNPLYKGKTENDFEGDDLEKFKKFKRLESNYNTELNKAKKKRDHFEKYRKMLKDLNDSISLKLLTKKIDYFSKDFENFQKYEKSIKNELKIISENLKHYNDKLSFMYNTEFNARNTLKDDPLNMDLKVYGDNNVRHHADDEIHGTHVAGIILADRNNDIGLRGIVDHAKLMSVRVVPNGDEYDKDIALGIIYAVDNGAKVINASFGKEYSPNVKWVHDAIKYAAEADVLIVKAAGNNSKNLDEKYSYPNDTEDGTHEISDNFITVGASTRFYDQNLAANFSNYGKKTVDIFAPGEQIYSSIPNNKYKKLDGTSMASPNIAGIAALIRSYYPNLTASQVKHIIMNSGTLVEKLVFCPGNEKKEIPFSDLSKSGRIANAYTALKMAEKIYNQ